MRPSHTLRALGAAALVGGLSLSVAPTAYAAPAPAGTLNLQCQTSTFPAFSWTPAVQAEAITDGTQTWLQLGFSDLPGKSPAPLNDLEMVATLDVEVDGKAVTLTGSKRVSAAANSDIPLPAASAVFAGAEADIDVVVKKVSYNIAEYQMNTLCPAGSGSTSQALNTIPVASGTLPAPTPTPTPTSSPTPTPTKAPQPKPSPTKAPEQGSKGKAAKGTVKFDCTLQTIGSPFKYHPTVTLEGARAKADDDNVSLRLAFSDIKNPDTGKGLAPVPMDGNMKITATAKVDGQDVDFSGSAPVVVGPSEPVAVPVMTKDAKISGETVPVEITAFKFDFGTIAGTQWYSDCKGSGALSDMTIGVGELPDAPPGGGGDGGGETSPAGTTTLPKTGGGDAMPVIALWALALGVVGAGLLVWMPAQRRSAS